MPNFVKLAIITIVAHIFLCSAAPKSENAGRKPPAISITSMEIPYAYTEDGSGVYHTILNKLSEGYDNNIDITFMPSARFDRALHERKSDCYYISTDNQASLAEDGIDLNDLEFIGPIKDLKIMAYIPKGNPIPKSTDDLKSLRLIIDVNLQQAMLKHGLHTKFMLQDQKRMIKMLAMKRAEAMIGFNFDIDLIGAQLGLTNAIQETPVVLRTMTDGILCYKTQNSSIFRQHLRTQMKKLNETGWIKEAFDNFFKTIALQAN